MGILSPYSFSALGYDARNASRSTSLQLAHLKETTVLNAGARLR